MLFVARWCSYGFYHQRQMRPSHFGYFNFKSNNQKNNQKNKKILTFVKIYLHSSKNDKLESTHKNAMISEVIQKCKCFKYNEYIKPYQVVF